MATLPRPSLETAFLGGFAVDLERVDPGRHTPALWDAIGSREVLWAGIPSGPFDSAEAFATWLAERADNPAQHLFAIIDKTADEPSAAGLFFLINTDPAMGRTEIGLVYGAAITRRIGGTEAFYLLARHVFETGGYRRLEWRCNPDNLASRNAAERYGFTFEGVLRQNLWIKGASWDTAVYSMLDSEWPDAGRRLAAWLSPDNFTPDGRQIRRLGA
ncbi:MAG: GNAT family protein [Caulobacteraceae bacterium]|nr:GNAT family protein [Caulobacteraceae bacterium]